MRQILRDLDLAIYQCNVSIQDLESALELSAFAFELSYIDAVVQTGLQFGLDDLRVGALLYALIHQN